MATGATILESLRVILDRHQETIARIKYPGEGGERPFRFWLATDFLVQTLTWPVGAVVIGEVFDILLRDGDGFPVVTIETKGPYHKATKKEREDFRKRLAGYGTLRSAYFTNGAEWEQLETSPHR